MWSTVSFKVVSLDWLVKQSCTEEVSFKLDLMSKESSFLKSKKRSIWGRAKSLPKTKLSKVLNKAEEQLGNQCSCDVIWGQKERQGTDQEKVHIHKIFGLYFKHFAKSMELFL